MPNFEPPFDLDPYAIIRDKDRQHNYSNLFLRGIYSMMKRYEDMELLERFLFAHNTIAMTLVKKADKARFNARDGFMTYTSIGQEREGEVQGWRKMSKERQKEKGHKMGRQEMQRDTKDKLKELDELLEPLMKDPRVPGNPPGRGRG